MVIGRAAGGQRGGERGRGSGGAGDGQACSEPRARDCQGALDPPGSNPCRQWMRRCRSVCDDDLGETVGGLWEMSAVETQRDAARARRVERRDSMCEGAR
eukprot:681605-Rhodomonas_salina.2